MIRLRCFLLAAAVCLSGSSAWAQIGGNQTGGQGGATGGTTGGGTTGQTGGGGFGGGGGLGGATTGGIGGITAQGGAGAADQSAEAGGNAAQGFVGAGDQNAFVGGAREAETNSQLNRLFRGITDAEVPTGTTQESTGNPRRIPVQLKLGFAAPPPRAAMALAGSRPTSLDHYVVRVPSLQGVRVQFTDDGTATLSGSTGDAASRRLAENLMRLQPGVRRVRSQIRTTSVPLAP